ncbi:MAG: hypothetical protein J0L88_06725 [Xanthomonadales bacterium]|nr:hypothetical protein [Xanthomonadales bacterium]
MNTPLRDALLPYAPRDAVPAKRTSTVQVLAFLVLCGFGGAVIGSLLAMVRHGFGGGWLGLWLADVPSMQPGWVVLFTALMAWPHVLVHETGHALAGLARGMQPLAFGVGPWRWERSLDRWRLLRAPRVRGISGFAILLPRGARGQSRLDQVAYLAGGPFANFVTLALALGLLPLTTHAPLAGAFLAGTAIGAAFVGLVNLVPFSTAGWRSDGRNLVDLMRRSPEAETARRVRETLGLTMAGVRPRDWPASSLPPLSVHSGRAPTMLDTNAASQVLTHAIDAQDAALARAAARALAAGHAHVPEALRPHIAIGMAAFAACIERDADLLAAWRPLCEGGLFDLATARTWLDAELAAMRADAEASRAAIATARALRDRVPDALSRQLLDERLDALEARLASPPRHDS